MCEIVVHVFGECPKCTTTMGILSFVLVLLTVLLYLFHASMGATLVCEEFMLLFVNFPSMVNILQV